ncbi:MAG: hypothetical protein KDJ19_00555 [Hyphomicrobiaceae bacterium]|nr:hypothetical protein [Hyphomicrobiaceae bacterium]MCC0024598.1 hypothetical protein [Hyphomicrobiaceae bacterium]
MTSPYDLTRIAHQLSQLPRWLGRTDPFYSVAEHSCRVVLLVPDPAHRVYALLHDAPEALVAGDVPDPEKFAMVAAGYDLIARERRHFTALCQFLGLPPIPADAARAIEEADHALRHAEYRDLVPHTPERDWTPEGFQYRPDYAARYRRTIVPRPAEQVRADWLQRTSAYAGITRETIRKGAA